MILPIRYTGFFTLHMAQWVGKEGSNVTSGGIEPRYRLYSFIFYA